MSVKNQITGGAFQDATGNLLVNGYLLFELSQDGQVNGSTELAAGFKIKIPLDASGNVVTSPTYSVWPNDVITPINTFYNVSAYSAHGQLVWGPNAVQVFNSPSPYNIGAWVPDAILTNSTPIVTYDIGCYTPFVPTASETVLLLPIERSVRFAVNLAPSLASCGVNATSSSVYSVKKNGTQFATITFTSSGASGTISSSGTVFVAGDILTIVAPASPDATLANVGILLSGTALN